MTEANEPPDALQATRQEHHQEILAGAGYPTRFVRSAWASDLHEKFQGLEPGTHTEEQVAVAGRVMLHRSFGKLQFATIRDMTGTIQLFVDRGHIGDDLAAEFGRLDLGDWVGASGTVMTTRKGELSVQVDEFVILQKSLRPLPDKFHGLQDVEQRSRRRYLDLMVNDDAFETAMTRARVLSELRREFENRGFIEVETPVLLSQATGANARPFATRHEALDMEMFLRIATELHLKRLVIGGIERVFEIGRIFRNEGIDATHNPEFTMLEAYQALADYNDIMVLVEDVVSSVAVKVTGSETITYRDRELSLSAPFRRATLVDLVSEVVGEPVDLDTPVGRLIEIAGEKGVPLESDWTPGRVLLELYEELVEPTIWEPTFVTHQPVEVSPLSRRNQNDPRLADRFELVIAGSEYANAFSELNDADDQLSRFEAQARARLAGDDEAHPVDTDYIEALEYGLPPTGGLGIGVDRLVMLLTNQTHIREVILFPTMRAVPPET
ncbi:MAG: lysine--tRNA ligase [Acidimicrobiia bacterium]